MFTCKDEILKLSDILDKIKELKSNYEKEGFLLLGVFGSYAQGNASKDSDIDILYDVDSKIFCKQNKGFKAFKRIREIKEELEQTFQKNVDLATVDNSSKTFQNFALKDVKYVA